jgi:phosphate transport system substrate-binding protein
MSKTVRLFIFMLVALSLVLAACGAPAEEAPAVPAETEAAVEVEATEGVEVSESEFPEPADVTGDIITAGSSTVFPVSERMAELFQQEGYEGNITVDSIGTGAGFERFCVAGESDISNASRPIKDSEKEACQSIGREPLEFRVGTDALAVVVSSQNDFITSISLENLAKIFSGEIKNWNELDASYPAEAIKVYSPGSDSGTFDYFVEAVMDPAYENGEEALLSLEGVQLSEDDNVLVQGVAGDKYAIGYFGYAYYIENAGSLNALNVNDVEPSQANVDNGTYPIARPIFIYSTAQIMQEKPQVSAFIAFYLNNLDDNIVDVGYFPAPAAEIEAAWDTWYSAQP